MCFELSLRREQFRKVKGEPIVNFTALMKDTTWESYRRTFRQLLLPIANQWFRLLIVPNCSALAILRSSLEFHWSPTASLCSSSSFCFYWYEMQRKRYFEPISLGDVWLLGMVLYWKNFILCARQSYCQGNVMKIPLLKKKLRIVGDHPNVHYLERSVAPIPIDGMQSWFNFRRSHIHRALFSSLIKDEIKCFSPFWKYFP